MILVLNGGYIEQEWTIKKLDGAISSFPQPLFYFIIFILMMWKW
jgi:hypothetical protein